MPGTKGSGPRKLPSNILRLHGETRPSRFNEDEPKPEIKAPPPPDWLTPEGQNVWTRTARLLAGMRVMSEADVDMLTTYCESWLQWQEAAERVRDLGMVVKHPKTGAPMRNPYWSCMKESGERCHRIMIEFGMSPSARTRIRAD